VKNKPRSCINCGTVRYPHYRRGYCADCYRLIRKKAEISKWEPKTITELDWNWPRGLEFDDFLSNRGPGIEAWKRHIPRVKEALIETIDAQLERLKDFENWRSINVKGSLISWRLKRLVEHMGIRDTSMLEGVSVEAQKEFNAKQRKILHRWLLDVEERITVRRRRLRKNLPH
jgi:hypothetical protein